jgi:hypothetical protein
MNYQPAFSYPLEELTSGLLYLDTNMEVAERRGTLISVG